MEIFEWGSAGTASFGVWVLAGGEKKKGIFLLGIKISHQDGAEINSRVKMRRGAEIFQVLGGYPLEISMFLWNNPWDSSQQRILEHSWAPQKSPSPIFLHFSAPSCENAGKIHFTLSYFHICWFKSCFLRCLIPIFSLFF